MQLSAACAARSVEVRDFEEEKSLDKRRRGPGGCRRAGRLRQRHLFCGPDPAPQRADQPRSDRHSEPQRLHQGRAAVCGCLLRHPQRLQRTSRPVFHLRVIGAALPITIQNMPEETTGAVYGSGDGSLDPDQLREGEHHGQRLRAERPFRRAFLLPGTRRTFLRPARALTCSRWWTTSTAELSS